MVSVNLTANTDLKTPEEFRQLVVKEDHGTVVRLGDIADVVLGAENYDQDVRFNGESAIFMGIWVLPTANTLDVIGRVREAIPGIRAQLPAGMKVGLPYDSTVYIQDSIREVLKTLSETLLIVILVIFLFLGSVRSVIIPVVAIPISLVGAVFLMHGGRLHRQPADAARHRALGRPGGRRRDRDGGERRAPPARGQEPAAGGPRRRPRAGGPDHRDDHHPGGGLHARRHPGRADRLAVPRVRLHPRRRGDRLRRGGAHPVADDGLEAPARRRHRARLRRLRQPPVRVRPARLYAGAGLDAAGPARRAHPVGDRHRC